MTHSTTLDRVERRGHHVGQTVDSCPSRPRPSRASPAVAVTQDFILVMRGTRTAAVLADARSCRGTRPPTTGLSRTAPDPPPANEVRGQGPVPVGVRRVVVRVKETVYRHRSGVHGRRFVTLCPGLLLLSSRNSPLPGDGDWWLESADLGLGGCEVTTGVSSSVRFPAAMAHAWVRRVVGVSFSVC